MALRRTIGIFLTIVFLATLTLQLPLESADEVQIVNQRAHEEARIMWNRYKEFRRRTTPKRRPRRDTPMPQPQVDGSVAVDPSELEQLEGEAPKYILEVYKNLSSTTTQANTIRSLEMQTTRK